ncbi:hypothetical protein C1E24_20400 [Pseudoalteromonas phenolica]|uniref:Uncharacterized protein n=1 Tax=Pseudoalteromonas phenolica TaxID=161398 RepID=A0A5R9PXN6_9GAMM|nr:hypothetical protein [Pseudoalteromonas phenolica]TLX45162.1 hypothetical protein C1E24_20400 [Pseudoalteromonas phenolica]
MKLKLKKSHLKTLSKDLESLPVEQTPNVAGGTWQTITITTTVASHPVISCGGGCGGGGGGGDDGSGGPTYVWVCTYVPDKNIV